MVKWFLRYWKITSWKAMLELRKRDFVSISWNFLKENLAQSCFFFKKIKIYISTKRCNKWILCSFKYEFEYMVWHSQQICREFLCHCFCCCEYFFRKIKWLILSGFFPLTFFGISQAMVKTDVKNVFWRVYFSTGIQTLELAQSKNSMS